MWNLRLFVCFFISKYLKLDEVDCNSCNICHERDSDHLPQAQHFPAMGGVVTVTIIKHVHVMFIPPIGPGVLIHVLFIPWLVPVLWPWHSHYCDRDMARYRDCDMAHYRYMAHNVTVTWLITVTVTSFSIKTKPWPWSAHDSGHVRRRWGSIMYRVSIAEPWPWSAHDSGGVRRQWES